MLSLQPKSKVNPPSKKEKDFQADVRSFTKELVMEFHVYEKSELMHALELSDYNLPATQAYLRKTSKSKVRATIAKFLAGELEPGLAALGFDEKKDAKVLKNEPVVEEEVLVEYGPIGPNQFERRATNEMIHYILDMLDPESLMKAGFTCKRFYQISLHPLIYKKFCKKLYPTNPPLPLNTPFNTLAERISNGSINEYSRQIIQKAREDIRSLVWLPSVKSYGTPTVFYKQFKDFRDVFLNAPRVRIGGVYMMKEKYIRSGTKELTSFYDPYHTIEFFRYFRFFPDGLAMSCLSVNRLKKDKLLKVFFTAQDPEEEYQHYGYKQNIKSLMKGEYIVKKSSVHIRMNSKPAVYEYEVEIGSSAPGLFDQLKMVSQHMRMPEHEHRESLESKDHRGTKTFKFIKVPGFLEELDKSITNVAS